MSRLIQAARAPIRLYRHGRDERAGDEAREPAGDALGTAEAIGARWEEFDLKERIWIVPEARMKAGKEHRVPLSDQAVAVVQGMADARVGDFVFPGRKPTNPLSNMAMLLLLHRMGRADLTAHGFQSTFRDWTAEQTSYPHEVAEMALTHTVSDKAEAAYRRGDLFEKRRELMHDWADYCGDATRISATVP